VKVVATQRGSIRVTFTFTETLARPASGKTFSSRELEKGLSDLGVPEETQKPVHRESDSLEVDPSPRGASKSQANRKKRGPR